ncbi:hypothetical protein AVEN_425-1 [Araneus ventricosus]|uniref:Uncharacterized protein n=1 Tax=Araneus ventricosus TaxID=182803 RepID=A0A4Y2PXG5_ARAVE|nr:hypothetical protein AVEN_425-1 [Araneus ventricosus]
MQLLASSISYSEICKYKTSMTMNTLSEVQDNGFVQLSSTMKCRSQHSNCGWNGTFHVMRGVHCVTPVSAVQTCSCIPPWIGARLCPTKGHGLPDRGHDLLYGATSVRKLVTNYR